MADEVAKPGEELAPVPTPTPSPTQASTSPDDARRILAEDQSRRAALFQIDLEALKKKHHVDIVSRVESFVDEEGLAHFAARLLVVPLP